MHSGQSYFKRRLVCSTIEENLNLTRNGQKHEIKTGKIEFKVHHSTEESIIPQ